MARRSTGIQTKGNVNEVSLQENVGAGRHYGGCSATRDGYASSRGSESSRRRRVRSSQILGRTSFITRRTERGKPVRTSGWRRQRTVKLIFILLEHARRCL